MFSMILSTSSGGIVRMGVSAARAGDVSSADMLNINIV